MSYGSVYIESDINKLRKANYSKRYIIRIISRRIKYRYFAITIKDAKKIATDIYEGKDESKGWLSKKRSSTTIKITQRERKLWNKLNLDLI